jgi:transcriptional regulator with XRE-family HTH domain
MFEPSGVLTALGDALRESRTARRISQEELSLRTGVHRNYIGGIERAERNPSVVTLARLADGLGLSLCDLLCSGERGERDPGIRTAAELAHGLGVPLADLLKDIGQVPGPSS